MAAAHACPNDRAGDRRRKPSLVTRGSIPRLIASENRGAVQCWGSDQHDVTLDFSRPGKPTDNAFIEAFNGRLRAECLNTHWFLSLDDARGKLERWRRHYNEVRPHGVPRQL